MVKTYKNKNYLKQKYEELGSTRRVGKFFNVVNGVVIYWMKKFGLPRIPKLYLVGHNSGKGRLGELYVLDHPYFKKNTLDIVKMDDKNVVDLIWRGNKVNVKTSHYKRPIFRIKNGRKRHNVSFYVCLFYIDRISWLIPEEIWILPSGICPYSNISPGLKSKKSKYFKYKISLLRDRKFSVKKEGKYNKEFIEKYKNCRKEVKNDKKTRLDGSISSQAKNEKLQGRQEYSDISL